LRWRASRAQPSREHVPDAAPLVYAIAGNLRLAKMRLEQIRAAAAGPPRPIEPERRDGLHRPKN